MKKLSILSVAAALVVCGSACKSTKAEHPESQEGKTLVLFYSQTGATRSVAEERIDSSDATSTP